MSRDLLDEQGRSPDEVCASIRAQLAALIVREREVRSRPRVVSTTATRKAEAEAEAQR